MSPTSEVAASAQENTELPAVEAVADGCLLLSHRLTEWVGNAPTMEEDVALGNIALDLLGQTRGLLSFLGDEDQLAYFRDADDFRNPAICAAPNGDFAKTMLRQVFARLLAGAGVGGVRRATRPRWSGVSRPRQ